MTNDYIRGLDTQKNRITEEAYLALFTDLRDVSQRMHHMRDRTITQFSSNVEGYDTDPRGAGLAYSKWLSKWYVGMGRCKRIFQGLMDNIHRVKSLLEEDGVSHEEVFTQKLEEAIIRSFCRIVLPSEIGVDSDAIEWYRTARPHNKVHCLELCFAEKLLPVWDTEVVGWEDPGVDRIFARQARFGDLGDATGEVAGITIPLRQVDTFADNQVEFLKACFGEESAGPPGDLSKQPVCKLIERALSAAVGKLVTNGLEHEVPFDISRTYIQELDAEEMYSVMVCIGTYFHIEQQQVVPVDGTLKALEGISLLHPGHDILHLATGTDSPLMFRSGTDAGAKRVQKTFADLEELHQQFDGSAEEWAVEMGWLMGVRTDLYRLLKGSGWEGPMSGMSFMVNYAEGKSHFGVEELCRHPAKNLVPAIEKYSFWKDGVSRGKVPIDCITQIRAFNTVMVNWAARIRGFKPIGGSEAAGFLAIGAPKNSNDPAPIRPDAVRPIDIEVGDTQWGYKRSSPEARGEPELNMVRVDLDEPPAKVKFFSDEPHEDPEPPKEIKSQVWIWGLLILLLLAVVTYRNKF